MNNSVQILSQKSKNKKCFRIIIVGNASVGKTSLLLRYVDNEFFQEMNSTVGLDYRAKIIKKDNDTFKIQLWDTAGQERYRNIVVNYFKYAKAACLVFDISKLDKFEEQTQFWLAELNKHCEGLTSVLIGNKCDLLQNYENKEDLKKHLQQVQLKIKDLQIKYKCKYFMVSCKTGENIETVFDYMFNQLYELYKSQQKNGDEIKNSVLVNVPHPIELKKKQNDGCC